MATSGTTTNALLRKVSSTTLVSLFDDLKPKDLIYHLQRSFFNSGSVLITCSSEESSRLEGRRLLRFQFTRNPNQSSENESQIVSFSEDNKGLIVAWGRRMITLLPEVTRRATAIESILKNTVQSSDQDHFWREAAAKVILVNVMIHATADSHPRTVEIIQTLCGNPGTISLVRRLQHSILRRIRLEPDVAVLTWINPSVRVTPRGAQAWVPGFAIHKNAFENLDVSWSEVCEARIESSAKTITFARNSSATLRDLRQHTRRSTTARGIKFPTTALDQNFLDWISYYIGEQAEEPEEAYDPVQRFNAALSQEDLGRVELIEKEMKDLVADLFT